MHRSANGLGSPVRLVHITHRSTSDVALVVPYGHQAHTGSSDPRSPVVIVDGRVEGTWELMTGKRGGIAVQPLEPWRSGVKAELKAEVDRVAAFLDRPLPIDVAASP